MSKLYSLGCSFARGNIADRCNHLCETHLGPGKLIADYLNLEEVNLARNGNSLDGILKDLYSLTFEEDSLILIGTPPKSRFYMSTNEATYQNKKRNGKNSKILRRILKNNIDAQNTIINAFTQGPIDKKDNFFTTEKWDSLLKINQKIKLDDHVNFRFLLDLLCIQTRIKSLNLKYIIYNNLADFNFQTSNWELNAMIKKIDFEYYYKPKFKMFDLTENDSDESLKFSIANGDKHPNHLCYYHWFEGIKLWLKEKNYD